jgi:hypothetical protein
MNMDYRFLQIYYQIVPTHNIATLMKSSRSIIVDTKIYSLSQLHCSCVVVVGITVFLQEGMRHSPLSSSSFLSFKLWTAQAKSSYCISIVIVWQSHTCLGSQCNNK